MITLTPEQVRLVTQQNRRGISSGDVVELANGRLAVVRRVDARRRRLHAQQLDVGRGLFDKAKRAYASFTGRTPGHIEMVPALSHPGVCFVLGTLEGVIYSAVVDGSRKRYYHRFKTKARPHLASGHDGRQLYILGGGYRVTDRGITDL